jgi:NAD(P)-dependent dehydrogenase (short-subunit alcohol dehydrogenase family)/acyl carrier protein
MLRLDLDLEADLGIDSIKRVEIVGSLRDELNGSVSGAESDLMDQLARARTLGAIIERVKRHLSPPRDVAQAGAAGRTTRGRLARNGAPFVNDTGGRAAIRRMTIEAVDAPLPETGAGSSLRSGGLVLLTDDQRGIADAAASRLRARGFRVIVAEHAAGRDLHPHEAEWTLDLASPTAVARLIDRARAEGPLCGVLHLLPLRDAKDAGLDPAAWAERMGPEVRGLFLIARAAADDLARSAEAGGAALVSASCMGGGLASLGDLPSDFFPGHGAIAGLVKTLGREWDTVRARVVDVARRSDPDLLAGTFVDELLADDLRTEVGYDRGRRVGLSCVESSLPQGTTPSVVIRAGEPILITGGARGITAAVTRDLAAQWRPTLLLLGG